MKRTRSILRAVFIIALSNMNLDGSAQRYVDVTPDPVGEIGSLNSTIRGDTTNAGERIDPENTIYRLQRDATYRLNLAVLNAGFPLVIEAAEGTGERPRIVPGVTIEGNSDVPFRPLNDFTLKGVFFTGRNTNSGLEDQLIRIQTENVRIIIDDCVIDESSQAFIRTDSRGAKIYVTNSIISRMGTPDDVDNGRVVDDRGNFIDTLIFENNAIYNVTSRVVRNGSGADTYMNYCRFNQNTIANVGQRLADFGPIINFTFTNNMVMNPAFLGVGVDPDPFNPDQPDPDADPTAALVLDSVSQEILDMTSSTQTATISNNNFFHTEALLNSLPERNPDPDINDLIITRPSFSGTAEAFIDDAGLEESNFSEDTLLFENAPPDPTVFAESFWDNIDGTAVLDPWDNTGAPYEFNYAGTFFSATASTTGEQIGDQNWSLIVFSVEALQELIATAEGYIAESEVGGNIGNIQAFAVDSLQRAIDASKLVADDPGSTPEDIEAAIIALNDAIDFFFAGLITSVPPGDPKHFRIYPNPAGDFFKIHSTMVINNISLWTLDGRKMGEWSPNSGQSFFNLYGLDPGVYIVRVDSGEGLIFNSRLYKK